MALTGEESVNAVINRFAESSWEGVAIKRGSMGPFSTSLADSGHPAFEPASKVVDTTAAGDSFNGGYLAAYLSGAGEFDRLLAGHQLAKKVVGYPGAIITHKAMAKSLSCTSRTYIIRVYLRRNERLITLFTQHRF